MMNKNGLRASITGGLFALLTFTNATESKALEVKVNLPGSKDQWGSCFQTAESKWKVPQQLLRAIANMESGGFHHIPEKQNGKPDASHPAFYGVMALRNDPILGYTLSEAAQLLKKDLHEIEQSPCLNIQGAAAVLAKHFKGTDRGNFEGYVGSLEHYWNFKNPAEAKGSIKNLQRFLNKGVPFGRVFLRSSPKVASQLGKAFLARIKGKGMATVDAANLLNKVKGGGGAEYSMADWNPSPNFNSGSNEDRYIVVHTTEGGFSGSSAWLRNPDSGVSAHYIIRKDDGYVEQLVRESDEAFHVRCWNSKAIGIETEGHEADPDNWTETLYDAIAQLTTYLVQKHGIPADRLHVIGHDFGQSGLIGQTDLENCNDHSDPGKYFDWSHFMGLIGGSYGNDGYDNGGYNQGGNNRGGSNGQGNGDYGNTPPSKKNPPSKKQPPNQDDGSGGNNGNGNDDGDDNSGEDTDSHKHSSLQANSDDSNSQDESNSDQNDGEGDDSEDDGSN